MARIRSMKPEFWSSPDVGDASRDARLLFLAMWNFADDAGRIEYIPQQLAATAFPFDTDVTNDMIAGWVAELVDATLVRAYARGRRQYLQITGWHHQRIDKPSAARCPDPDDPKSKPFSPAPSRDPRETLARLSDDTSHDNPSDPLDSSQDPHNTLTTLPPPQSTDNSLTSGNTEIRETLARPSTSGALDRRSIGPKTPPPPSGESPPSGGTRRRNPKTPLPDDWQPTDRHRELAQERGIDLALEANRFRDSAKAHDRRYADWNAAFRNWLTSEFQRPPARASPNGQPERLTAAEQRRRRQDAEIQTALEEQPP